MDFYTLHELARELNRPERVIRYRFHALRKLGKLAQGLDYVREDFVDEQHCVYKIDPLRFMEEAKIAIGDNRFGNNRQETGSLGGSEDTKPVINDYSANERSEGDGKQLDNTVGNADNQTVNKVKDSVNDADRSSGQGLSDYVDTLKEQLRVKDSQIEGYRTELSAHRDLIRGTVGELLKAQEHIRLFSSRTPDPPEDKTESADIKDNFVRSKNPESEDTSDVRSRVSQPDIMKQDESNFEADTGDSHSSEPSNFSNS